MHIEAGWFKDEHGRRLILRGVNLGGSSKVPTQPNGATHLREGFFAHRDVSFIGRPFPLEQADEHFARLRHWGLTFLRLLVTWEAVEHAGPGQYDQEFLDYLYAVVKKANDYGIRLFIDPHQDMWSRFSGGDGAPGWTLEAIGFDLPNLHETGAAFLHQVHGDPLPKMIWPTNATKLATATMFTLFFAGNDFAPHTQLDGEPVQEYLQRHYINAMKQIALRLRDLPNVVGYDSMNEPLPGYIGWQDLTQPRSIVELGAMPSPYQAMLLGAGIPQEVGIWERRVTGAKLVEKRLLNPERKRAWREDYDCVWRANGVWDFDRHGQAHLLRPDHFRQVDGRRVDFNRDYYIPFNRRFIKEIRQVHPDALVFVEEAILDNAHPEWSAEAGDNIVFAPHWYDGVVLFMKTFSPWFGFNLTTRKVVFGPKRIRKSFAEQFAHFKRHALEKMGGAPTLIGETGIAFDLQQKRAYRTGDFSLQVKAMDRTLKALDDTLLSYTLWTYSADNTNERGDQWNGEDFSIFSRDQQSNPADINSGGRALPAVVRPYPLATAGEPLQLSFDISSRVFQFRFQHDPSVTAPTLIFVPEFQFSHGCNVQVSDGSYQLNPEEQTLSYWHSQEAQVHWIRLMPK